MSGYLTQALANLEAAEQQINALSGLPSGAQQLQAQSSAIVNSLVASVRTGQQTCSAFAQQALPQLQQLASLASTGDPIFDLQARMQRILGEVGALKDAMNQVTAQINATSQEMNAYSIDLSRFRQTLNSQMAILQGQLAAAQSQENSTKQQYWYLLALGPFGLPGLAAALALYLTWQNDVNNYESQISALNNQINLMNAMSSACGLMISEFQGVATKMSGVANSVDFLVGDCANIEDDLTDGSSSAVLSLKVNAALLEVQTLATDAS